MFYSDGGATAVDGLVRLYGFSILGLFSGREFMRVAIAHYWLVSLRGGEKVVQSMLQLFPDADIYTLFADRELVARQFPHNKVYSSPFDVGFIRKRYQLLFPLYPLFVWSLKLRGNYDLLLSSESGPIKGLHKPRSTRHVCYVHSPMRYVWGFTHEYLRVLPPLLRPIAAFFFALLKLWDKSTVANVDKYLCNSRNVQQRITRYYQRTSEVVYPPIADKIFADFPVAQESRSRHGRSYFLCFGALVPYKRIDLAVRVFNENGLELRVYGVGSEFEKLQKIAKPNVQILGALADDEFVAVLAQARALVFPGEEDFGMIPLEVMALGTPVIAYGSGGALETVVESDTPTTSTGLFFAQQKVEALQEAVEKFCQREAEFDPHFIHAHAQAFSEQAFLDRMKAALQHVQ